MTERDRDFTSCSQTVKQAQSVQQCTICAAGGGEAAGQATGEASGEGAGEGAGEPAPKPQDAAAPKDFEDQIRQLDLQLLYLWRAHGVDYYAGKENFNPETPEMPPEGKPLQRCTRPEEGEQVAEAEGELLNRIHHALISVMQPESALYSVMHEATREAPVRQCKRHPHLSCHLGAAAFIPSGPMIGKV